MKLKLKILKESNRQESFNTRYQGLYDHMSLHPGSLDLFISHFADYDPVVQNERRELLADSFGEDIESLTDADIPRTSARGYGSALTKVKAALYAGHSHWYKQIFGEAAANFVIETKVLAYILDLKENLDRIGYKTITAQEFQDLPSKDKNIIYEKHFLDDYLDSFVDDHVKMNSMNTTGFLDNPGVGAGLYGQMKDWYMSTAGADFFKMKLKEYLGKLPQRAS